MLVLLIYQDTLIVVSVSDIIFLIVLPSSLIIILIMLSGIKILSITSLEHITKKFKSKLVNV